MEAVRTPSNTQRGSKAFAASSLVVSIPGISRASGENCSTCKCNAALSPDTTYSNFRKQ